jgi:glycosyltransferase involved in cell wall biosynthesis
MPTISVIVPAYNAERTVLHTIASIQQQTFYDFELIVINDGSTDRTLELLGTVKDPRLKVFSYKNGGLPVARNRGISHASGEFLAFLDADDLWTADKLELQLTALQQHPEAGVAYSWTRYMDEQGESFYPDRPVLFEGNVYAELLVNNFLSSGSNPLIRRQAIESIGEFDPAIPPCADWDFYLRLAARWSFVVVPKPQILYRQSSSSMSAKVEVMEKSLLILIEKIFRSAPLELQYLKNKSLCRVYQYLTGLCLDRTFDADEVKRAGQKLQFAIRLYPQTLLDKETQRCIMKWLLMRLLSPKVAKHFKRPAVM